MDVKFDELLNLKTSETEQIGFVSLKRKSCKHYGQSLHMCTALATFCKLHYSTSGVSDIYLHFIINMPWNISIILDNELPIN